MYIIKHQNISSKINIKEINVKYYKLTFSGLFGTTKVYLRKSVRCKVFENYLVLYCIVNKKLAKSLLKVYSTLLEHMLEDSNIGFSKILELKGIGYRLSQKKNELELRLGYSELIRYKLPSQVLLKFFGEQNEVIIFFSLDRIIVNKVISDLYNLRRFNPYKGKGFIYYKQNLVLKEGKNRT